MKIIFSDNQLKYDPKQEFSGHDFREYPEKPDRINWIVSAIQKENNDNHEIANPPLCEISKIAEIHDKGYIEFLKSLPTDIEEQVPMTIAPENIKIIPDSDSLLDALLGYYFFSVDTPITPYSFSAAHHSASSALDCVYHIMRNETISIGLSRPPGHHAMQAKGGGYCFFNNVAIAAKEAVNRGKSVSILDLDYHHGNGTQEIFYDTSKVQYVSIHAKDAYPYYWGARNEIGEGDGKNFNINYPLSNTTNSEKYDETLVKALNDIENYSPDIVLVSMGFDAYYKDPIAGMELTQSYYQKIGKHLSNFSKLGIILEGGYSEEIGGCFMNLLNGLI
ncbi:MAG: Acetylpolyamine aminohydrolase [Candidatus Heimdallarchaeota archaeon LC_2]|nr:MAG: Acetylpolyamine aminohydrolase [Candidatus Heimdallarchaeota archaeon LC_2]